MLYLDYHWDLSPTGIKLDEELNTSRHLGWEQGDYFQLVTIDGRQHLLRVDPIKPFAEGYKVNKEY
jgi:hypothetical protein